MRVRSFAAERAIALGEVPPFDFVLAERLGMTVGELHSRLGNDEYVEWIAFYKWRGVQQKHADDVARMRSRGHH